MPLTYVMLAIETHLDPASLKDALRDALEEVPDMQVTSLDIAP